MAMAQQADKAEKESFALLENAARNILLAFRRSTSEVVLAKTPARFADFYTQDNSIDPKEVLKSAIF